METGTAKYQKTEKNLISEEVEVELSPKDELITEESANEEITANKKRKRGIPVISVIVLILMIIALFAISITVAYFIAQNKDSSQSFNENDSQTGWTKWSDWEPCSTTCDIGEKRRIRTCMAGQSPHGCEGKHEEFHICVMEKCNDDIWLEWTKWSPCKKLSGICSKTRNRACQNKALNIQGVRCVGDTVQDHHCKPEDCHGSSWAEWQEWTSCSSDCDAGIKTRERLCTDHNGQKLNISECEPGINQEKEWCHIVDCKDNITTCASFNPCVYGTCVDHDAGSYCSCEGAWGKTCNISMHDCLDIKETGRKESGVYSIRLKTNGNVIDVLCEMESHEGGWTVFQHRIDGSVDFYRNFSDYKNGFGDPQGEYWLGLDSIYQLSDVPTMLLVELTAADNETGYHLFQDFGISNGPEYFLYLANGSGTAGNWSDGIYSNNGENFKTYDHDNHNNCSEKDHGGWWFTNCGLANLHGFYAVPGSDEGYNGRQEAAMIYHSFRKNEALKASKMMLKRKHI